MASEQGVGQGAAAELNRRQPGFLIGLLPPSGQQIIKDVAHIQQRAKPAHRGEQACAGKPHGHTRREVADLCSSKRRCTCAAELSAQQLLRNQVPVTSRPPAGTAHPAGEVIIRRMPSNSGPAPPPTCCCSACGAGLAAPVAALGLPPASGMLGGGPSGVGAAGKGSRRWAAGAG